MTKRPISVETPEAIEQNDVPEEAVIESAAKTEEPAAEAAASEPPPTTAAAPPRPAAREPLRRPAPAPAPAAAAPKLQPSWVLSATGEQLSREELLARYRRQRALPDDPFENEGRPVPPPGYRDRIMQEKNHSARFVERAPREAAPPPPRARTFTLGQTFAIAAGMALAAGATAGVLSARFSTAPVASATLPSPVLAVADAPPAEAAPVQAVPQLKLAQAAAPAHNTVIDKKPVSTATLEVADVSGETNSFIPLALRAEPAGLNEDMLLKISGVPEGAYLTSGHREDDQIWSLSLAELKDVKLVVPKAETPQIDLAVAAFEPKTGELAAPVKTMTVALKDVVVEPTSAPPPDQTQSNALADGKSALPVGAPAALPAPIPVPQSISVASVAPGTPPNDQLLSEADALFKSGDVRAARKNYERAWGNDGSPAAAFGIARSYDPVVLASLALKNVRPDKDQAIQWYQRAASGGNAGATEAIVRLQLKP